jgi:hypothetical protein
MVGAARSAASSYGKGRPVANDQRTTAEIRQALRARYTPEPVPTCPHCGDAMNILHASVMQIRWTCLDHGHIRYTRAGGDPVIIAAVDDADALAGALADVERYKVALAQIVVAAVKGDAERAGEIAFIAGASPEMRSALASQSVPAPESAPDAPRIAQDAPQGANRPKAPPAKIAGATGDSGAKTEADERE